MDRASAGGINDVLLSAKTNDQDTFMTYSSLSQSSGESLAESSAATSRRDRVLDEAAKQLNANGVSLTSLAEIAAKLGISRAAMYYYVEDRQDLVFQCYRRAGEVTSRHLRNAINAGGNAKEILTRFIDGILDPNEPEIAASAEIAMMTDEQRAIVATLFDAVVAELGAVLETGRREGLFRSVDPYVNARTILSLMSWAPLVQRWSRLITTVSRERIIEVIKDMIFEGMAAPGIRSLSYEPIDLSAVRIRVSTTLERDAISEVKREALIGVASRLFNRKGIDSTSLEEIAAQVGATKRTLHRHLGSKQALVDACYERAFQVFLFIMESMLKYRGTRLEALGAAFHAASLLYPREDIAVLAPQVGLNALQPEAQRRLTANTITLSLGYTRTINEGIAAECIRPGDIEARIMMIPGAFTWLVRDDGPTDSEQREDVARKIAELLTLGLKQG
jgi:AcrR family transcriptional regulator